MVFSAARENMHMCMQTFPQEGAYVERGRIPVDNSEFSTFSTAFSTRVFHSFGSMWIYRSGSHKSRRQPSPKFPLFRGSWILPQGFICAKNQDLTRFAPAGNSLRTPAVHPHFLISLDRLICALIFEALCSFRSIHVQGTESSTIKMRNLIDYVRNALSDCTCRQIF